MNYAKKVELIETTLLRRGNGTEDSPTRIITQWFDLEGNLVAERDPCSKVVTVEMDNQKAAQQ